MLLAQSAGEFAALVRRLGLRPRFRGRGSRPARAASRSRNGGDPRGRPIVSAARKAATSAGDQIGEASSTAGKQRGDLDQPVVLAAQMRPHARPRPVLRALDEPRARTGFMAT